MKPSGRRSIMEIRKKPKMPNEIAVTSKSSPKRSGMPLSSAKRNLSIIDSATAPRITPAMFPMPPMMTMHSTNTEKPNSNWSTLTVLR
jgi:hypothetical protein